MRARRDSSKAASKVEYRQRTECSCITIARGVIIQIEIATASVANTIEKIERKKSKQSGISILYSL
jgi:cell division ATPase FtsA